MATQELGNGWVAALDPGSGRTYYANTVTGATSWEYPAELGQPEAAAPEVPAAPPAAEAALPPGWVAAQDPGSGRTYYANTVTGVTQWDIPTEAVQTTKQPVWGLSGASTAAPDGRKKLSPMSKGPWKRLVDYSRMEATSQISAKATKFAGLRKFAEVAAAKKQEAVSRKAGEAADKAAADAAAAVAKAQPRKPILTMLDVDVPPLQRQNIEEYAENYFNLNRKGMFAAKTTVSKILSWKNEVIRTALLKMPTKELEQCAIQCFRNITGFMGDRNTNKEDVGHAGKLLQTCLPMSQELRDEVYCQIIKQTTNNPSPESTLKGWMLLGVVAGAFAPSKEFEPYLLSYCDAHREDGAGVGPYALYAMGRIMKTGSLGPRREVPTSMEIDACKARLPVLVRVYHLDGSFDTMPVTSWVTPSVLKHMVCEKRGIVNGDAFAVYEMTPEGEERYLEPDERVLDLVAYWQRLFEEEKQKGEDGTAKKQKKKATGNAFYRIVFKVHQYYEPEPEDGAAALEMYGQAVYDVVSARYPCGERNCLELASLQLQAEYGDAGLGELQTRLSRFLPAKYAEGTRGAELANEIRKLHAAHRGKTVGAVQIEYLTYVKEWQVYGSSFFFVEPQMNPDLPEEVFLAVNPRGILIINPDSKEVLASHPYSEVPTWGHSSTSFVLHIGNLIKQSKLYFSTEQGKEINDLVRNYVNHLVVG